MNLRKLFDVVMSEGGCSYSLTYGNVKRGYAVSIYPAREVQIPLSEFSETDLQNYALENSDLLSSPDAFLGVWIDSGTVYLDVSVSVTNKVLATKLCREHSQKAYFDLENKESIYV